MKHFIVGPVEMYPCTKEIYQNDYLYFRTEEFGNIVKDNINKLSKLIGNNTPDSLIYLTMSGTGAMEAVVENCTTAQDKVLVINGGSFGKRFKELLTYHNIANDSIDLKWNEALTIEHFSAYENKNYTMLFVNLHETSTGQLYDINIIKDFCKRNNLMLVVDAISTFLADEFDMEKFGIDATIISSQKGLCLSPGLSFVSLSERMLKKVDSITKPVTKYTDFKDYFLNIKRGQTPYTPAVFIMYELREILKHIDECGGLKNWLNTIAEKCNYFREKAKEIGLNIPDTYNLSNMLTPIICDDCNANEIVKTLRDKYSLCVNPCGGEIGEKMFRVSHIGNTTIKDFDNLIEKISITIKEIRSKQ